MTTAYIETTVPSFFHTGRKDTRSLARQRWTQEWWAQIAPGFELYTSDAVIAELQRGTREDLKKQRIELISDLSESQQVWEHSASKRRFRFVDASADNAIELSQ